MGHYYQTADIQDIADYIGDSLALAKIAADIKENVIVMCGVHFMGETAKILCPDKIVLEPDSEAGCSLADSCPAEEFKKIRRGSPRPHSNIVCQHLCGCKGTYRCSGNIWQCKRNSRYF